MMMVRKATATAMGMAMVVAKVIALYQSAACLMWACGLLSVQGSIMCIEPRNVHAMLLTILLIALGCGVVVLVAQHIHCPRHGPAP